MNLRRLGGAFALALLAAAPAPAQAGAALQVTDVTLRIRHRVFGNFREDRTVHLREVFQVGDTDYTGQVLRFVPDFAFDTKTRKVVTRSADPNNPAFQILVKEKGAPKDTTWAFLNAMPHFTRNSLLAFQVLRIDFKDHAPLIAPPDTAKAALAPVPSTTGKK